MKERGCSIHSNNDNTLRPKKKPATTLMFGMEPIDEKKPPAKDSSSTSARSAADTKEKSNTTLPKIPTASPKQVPVENRPIPDKSSHRTQLGLPAMISSPKIGALPHNEAAGNAFERFSFDDLDFAKMDTTVQVSPASLSDKAPTPTKAAVQTAVVEPDSAPDTVPDVDPDADFEEAVTTPPPKKQETATSSISFVPAPLPTPSRRRVKPLVIALTAGIGAGLFIVAVLFVIFGPEKIPAPTAETSKAKPASVSRPAPSAAPALPTAPTPAAKLPGTADVVPLPTTTPPVSEAPAPAPKPASAPAPTSDENAPTATSLAKPAPLQAAVSAALESPATASKAKSKSSDAEPKDTVQITLTGIPRDAEIFLNGTPVESVFTVPRSGKAVKVEVRRPGAKPAVRRIVPGSDKRVYIRPKK